MTNAMASRCLAYALYIRHASSRTPDSGFMAAIVQRKPARWGIGGVRGHYQAGKAAARPAGPGYRYDSRIMGGSDARPVVVLADDDSAITSNLAPFLDRAGFAVHVASDGEAVLELVERLDPDGCILDVLMPGPDG